MSILMKRRYLFEDGEEDNQAGGDTGTAPTVDTQDDAGGDTDNTEDTNTDDNNTEENSDDQNTDDNQEENTEDEDQNEDNDYDIDTEPDEEENTGDGEENNDDENSETDSNTDTEDKELDRQMFDSLSDSEKKRKISTLKKLYMELYSKCNVLIDKFNQITDDGNDDFKPVIKRILTVLYDLKEYISYYLLNVYDNNSYIENDINFNRYLSILNGIKHITEDLQKQKKKETEDTV